MYSVTKHSADVNCASRQPTSCQNRDPELADNAGWNCEKKGTRRYSQQCNAGMQYYALTWVRPGNGRTLPSRCLGHVARTSDKLGQQMWMALVAKTSRSCRRCWSCKKTVGDGTHSSAMRECTHTSAPRWRSNSVVGVAWVVLPGRAINWDSRCERRNAGMHSHALL